MFLFSYSAFSYSALMSTFLEPSVEQVMWRLNLALFAPTQGGCRVSASTSRPPVMVAIPVQSGAGVTVVVPPPSSARREEEIMAPESPGRGGLSSPAWS
jgi:hypothetical protein